jgi:hypothetical protein
LATKAEARTQALAKEPQLYNLCWAINNDKGIHSEAYAKAVWERLSAASAKGKDAVIDALGKMREILEKGESFW